MALSEGVTLYIAWMQEGSTLSLSFLAFPLLFLKNKKCINIHKNPRSEDKELLKSEPSEPSTITPKSLLKDEMINRSKKTCVPFKHVLPSNCGDRNPFL